MTTPKVVTVNESDLQCLICLDVLFHPYTLSACGHTFCGLCLQEKDLKIGFRHSTSVLCPHCRTNLGCVPSLFKNIQLSQLCESAYWTLPENNDKRREKQAQYDKRRAEIKRETELSNRKRSFTEFKAELNKLISYRGDIIDPESAKKMRTFVDEEMRMLPVEGPPLAPVAPAPIVVEDADVEEVQRPPYSDVIVSLMKNSVRTKTLAIARVQSQWYVHGFLEEIEWHVPQLQGIKNEVQEIYQAAATMEQHTQEDLGRSAARSWLLASFPFVRFTPVEWSPAVIFVADPYSFEQLTQMKDALQSKIRDMVHVQSPLYVLGFLQEITNQVPHLDRVVEVCSRYARIRNPVELTSCPDPWPAKIGRAAASSWLLATFPFVRLKYPPRAVWSDDDDNHRRRRVEEKMAPISPERGAQIAAEIVRSWNHDKGMHPDSFMEAYLNRIRSQVPGIGAILPPEIRDWRPGPSDASLGIQHQFHVLGRNTAEYVLSKYLRPSGTQQQPA